VEVCEGQSIFDSRTGGKKLQLHPLLKKKMCTCHFFEMERIQDGDMFFPKKNTKFFGPKSSHKKKHRYQKTPRVSHAVIEAL